MSWLRDILRREAKSPPRAPSTLYGKTIESLAAEDDPDERARLGRELAVLLEGAFGDSADNMHIALWQLREQLRQGQGETNDLVSEAVNLIRGQGAVLEAARAEFRAGLSALGERLSELELWRVDVDLDRESFKQSRDESIRERRELKRQYEEAQHERAELAAQGQETAQAVERMAGDMATVTAFMTRIEALIDRNPVADDERAAMLAFIRRQMAREREQGSS